MKLPLTAGFSIEGPSQAKIECDDKGDGSCDVRYWPTEPGDYAVHVICDDEDIKDSPFMAHVLPAANDTFSENVRLRSLAGLTSVRADVSSEGCFLSPQVKCSGPGLEPLGCIINKPAEFTIDTRGAGRGELKLYAQVKSPQLRISIKEQSSEPSPETSEDTFETSAKTRSSGVSVGSSAHLSSNMSSDDLQTCSRPVPLWTDWDIVRC